MTTQMETIQQKNKNLSADQLKLIAITAMTIDHLTWVLFPGTQTTWYVYALHIIGRLTAPIMWFFIAEGSFYTRDSKKYIARLFFFAFLSHFAYGFAFGIPFFDLSAGIFNRTSVIWSLAIAALAIQINKNDKIPMIYKTLIIIAGAVAAFPADWSSIAVMAPLYLYENRGNIKKQAWVIVLWTLLYATVYFLFLDKPYAILQMFTCLSIPFLSRYNAKKRNSKWMKWFFYIYYPAHLLIIGAMRLFLHGDISIIF